MHRRHSSGSSNLSPQSDRSSLASPFLLAHGPPTELHRPSAPNSVSPPDSASSSRRIHDLFAEQAARTPDVPAIEFGDESLTYRELDRRSTQIAHLLQRKGIGPDARVGIYMDRSILFVTSILAILKAGGAYVPLDPSYPSGRLEMMLEEASAGVLLTQKHRSEPLSPPQNTEVLSLDAMEQAIRQESAEPVDSNVTDDHLAYVLFTSGSTGRPKGVAMPHGPLVNLIEWQCDRSELGVGDRTLQFSALSFDVSFQELFSTWSSGGTLVLVTEETRRDAVSLLHLLERKQVQRLFLPFVALQHITEVAEAKDTYPSHLQEVITAGEQLKTVPSLQAFFRRLPECSLENQYGPTESHVVTAYRLPDDVEEWATLPSIGRPISNVDIHLLDDDMQPVPEGETGEIYIGGECLAREYLNRPEQTAESFLDDPFSDDPGARLYRTGDLARYQPDGTLEFLGRADHQVKVRGYRVELGEIEAVLNEHETVREAVVVPDQGSTQGNQTLMAYIIPQPGTSLDRSALRAYLDDQLPDYMVPSAYVELEEFPLTPSGKVDRKSLSSSDRPTDASRNRDEREIVEPRDELEQTLVDLWEEKLGGPIGIHDDFFSLGGHSIMAAEMLVTLSSLLGRELPLSLLADTPTIAALAEKLRRRADQEFSILVPIQQEGERPPLFCIHGGGMNVLRYPPLAKRLGDDQPVYGLQWIGLDGRRVPADIETIASRYLEEIRSVQPEGPYFFAGHCFGGIVAYEMALQLQETDEEVPLIIMFDGFNPTTNAFERTGGLKRLPSLLKNPGRAISELRNSLAFRSRLKILKWIVSGEAPPDDTPPSVLQLYNSSSFFRLWHEIRLRLGYEVPSEVRSNYAFRTMGTALKRYQPRPYTGRILLIHSGADRIIGYHKGRFTDGMLGWSTSSVEPFFHEKIPAGHNAIVDHPITASVVQTHIENALEQSSCEKKSSPSHQEEASPLSCS